MADVAATRSTGAILALKLRSFGPLSAQEEEILDRAMGRRARFEANGDIVREGDCPTESCLLVDGFAARSKISAAGARQITALHISGDFVDLHSFLLKPMDHSIVALTRCEVAYMPHREIQQFTEKQPHLTRLLWHNTLVDGAVHREWLFAMGRLSAAQHAAHLMCELYLRLRQVGLAKDYSFALPLTQVVLSDTLGLSSVHVNRSIQSLRGAGLLNWEGGVVRIKDWNGLTDYGDFDPAYLGLEHKVL